MNDTDVWKWGITTPFHVCEKEAERSLEHSNFILTNGLFFDLIPGVMSSGLVYQIFRGVEISHPIYAIIYSNVLFTTILTFISFLCSIINTTMVSCIPSCVRILINTGCFHLNTVSWMVIAFLRYILLAAKKANNHNDTLNLSKIRVIALISTWCLVLAVYIIRVMLFLAIVEEIFPYYIQFIGEFLMLLVFNIATYIVYYKLDIILEKKQEEETMKVRTISESFEQAENSLHHPIQLLENCRSADTFRFHGRRILQKNIIVPSFPSLENENYGGIYIGEDAKDLNQGTVVVTNLTKQVKIPDDYSKEREQFESEYAAQCNDMADIGQYCLPHQVHHIETQTDFSLQPKTIALKQGKQSFCAISSTESEQSTITGLPQRESTNPVSNYDPNAILVCQGSQESLTSHHSANHPLDLSSNEEDIRSFEDEYKGSKQHKSIIRAILANTIFILLFLILFAIMIIFQPIKHYNKTLLFILAVALKSYRTFAILLSSFYCFEIVNQLFIQLYDNTKFHLEILIERIRTLL